MNNDIFRGCLSKCKDLNLGKLQLKYLGNNNIPNLLTIYELIEPIKSTKKTLNEISDELENETIKEISLKGLFVLGIGNVEILLIDLLKRYLSLNPLKITLLKKDTGTVKQKKEMIVDRDDFFNGKIAASIIENELIKLSYGNLLNIIEILKKLLAIDLNILDIEKGILNEIKETRNLLIHNNLIVNSNYLTKSKEHARANKLNDKLPLDPIYIKTAINIMIKLVESIENNVLKKYGSKTLLALFCKLWEYTFKEHIRFDDYFVMNKEKDIYDGPYSDGKFTLSSSEKLFLDLWKSQRFSTSINEFNLCSLDEDNSEKMPFLIDIFSHLKLTHW